MIPPDTRRQPRRQLTDLLGDTLKWRPGDTIVLAKQLTALVPVLFISNQTGYDVF